MCTPNFSSSPQQYSPITSTKLLPHHACMESDLSKNILPERSLQNRGHQPKGSLWGLDLTRGAATGLQVRESTPFCTQYLRNSSVCGQKRDPPTTPLNRKASALPLTQFVSLSLNHRHCNGRFCGEARHILLLPVTVHHATGQCQYAKSPG